MPVCLPEACCRPFASKIKQMGPELGELAVEIVRFVEDYFPGIVACEFVDAEECRHTFIDKVPIFCGDTSLDASSKYPQQGAIRCIVLSRWNDPRGREVLRISTAAPDSVESTGELQEFIVFRTQVRRIPRGHRERNSQGIWVWVEDE